MDRKLLILDIDETLIYASECPLDRSPDFIAGHYFVYRRPELNTFLHVCEKYFNLAVWTSSNSLYANAVCSQIFHRDTVLEFLWSRERCTWRFNPNLYDYEWLKDLKKVKRIGYSLEKVLVVDDSPAKLSRNYGNLVSLKAFTGDKDDRELLLLSRYLPTLASVVNVRTVEKRYWRNAIMKDSQ